MAAAHRREIDVVLVWRLDRWGRSLEDLVLTLKELQEFGVAFVSLTEAAARWPAWSQCSNTKSAASAGAPVSSRRAGKGGGWGDRGRRC